MAKKKEAIEKTKQDDWGFKYKVWDSTIYVRNRPRSFEIESKDIVAADKADAYLSVTDTFVKPPFGVHFVWMPWNEGRKPTPELYYAANKALIWWTQYLKLPNIQVFCDGGTHRSVTIFGAFLMTYFSRAEAEAIVAKRIAVFDPKLDKRADGKPVDRSGWAQPLEYIDGYLEDFPQDRLLFEAMKHDRLGRLEGHCKYIWEKVKERYADNQGAQAL